MISASFCFIEKLSKDVNSFKEWSYVAKKQLIMQLNPFGMIFVDSAKQALFLI